MGEDAFTGNKSTRTFDAALAQKIGLNEAIVLSQIRYWVDRNREADRNYHDGKYWVYNTFEQWQEQFPWWSVRTLKSVFKSLENNGYIVAGHYNQKGYDRTKWYTLSEEMTSEPAENLIVQNLHDGLCNNCTMDSAEFARPIPEITTENTTEINNTRSTMVSPDERGETPRRHDDDSFPYERKITIPMIEGLFDHELLEDMMRFVSEYIDTLYPRYRHKNHPRITRASKAVYAFRLLLAAAELYIPPEDVKACVIYALQTEKEYDPRINLVTRPKALGVWLAEYGATDMNTIRESRFYWGDDFDGYKGDPFDPEVNFPTLMAIRNWRKKFDI